MPFATVLQPARHVAPAIQTHASNVQLDFSLKDNPAIHVPVTVLSALQQANAKALKPQLYINSSVILLLLFRKLKTLSLNATLDV